MRACILSGSWKWPRWKRRVWTRHAELHYTALSSTARLLPVLYIVPCSVNEPRWCEPHQRLFLREGFRLIFSKLVQTMVRLLPRSACQILAFTTNPLSCLCLSLAGAGAATQATSWYIAWRGARLCCGERRWVRSTSMSMSVLNLGHSFNAS